MSKAISAVVATVLLLMMTVSAAGIAYVWTGGIQSGVQEGTTTEAEKIQTTASNCVKVENVNGRTVYLRNCGNGVITANALLTYIDGLPANGTLTGSISPNTVGTLVLNGIWNLTYGNHKIRVTNGAVDVTQNVIAEVRKDGLAGYWKFDEGMGTTASDSSGNNNDGTLKNGSLVCSGNGCPKWVEGKFGKAISFDGENDTVRIPFTMTNFSFQTKHGPSTISLWSKANSLSGTTRIFSDNCFEWGVYHTGSTIYGAAYSGVNGGTIATGEWHNVVVVHEHPTGLTNTIIKLYVDGAYKGQATLTITTQNGYADNPFWIGADGCYGAASSFNGIIDDVKIYNKNLAPDDTINLKAA